MKVACIDFSETGLFAPIYNDFIHQKEELKNSTIATQALKHFRTKFKKNRIIRLIEMH